MVSQSHIVELISKVNPDVFRLLNKDVFSDLGGRLGSVQGAVKNILSPQYEQMLKSLMPTILTASPNDPTWYKRVDQALYEGTHGKDFESMTRFIGDAGDKGGVPEKPMTPAEV